MNKELINKYWDEFVHWKDGGNVQVKFMCDSEPKWYTDKESFEETGKDNFTDILCTNYNPKTRIDSILIVIDDEYIEFRKSLAEGKIIESQVQHSSCGWSYPSPGDELKVTRWKEDTSGKFVGEPRIYRVKPEEPKFKVGDWVILNHSITDVKIETLWQIKKINQDSITIYRYKDDRTSTYNCAELLLWEPKPYDWVIINSPRKYKFEVIQWQVDDTLDCQPFIGNLPSHLKDN